MRTMRTMISSKTFASNFIKIKNKIKEQLPTDNIIFQCCHCKSELLLNIDGVLQVCEVLDKELSKIIDEPCKSLIHDHHIQSEKKIVFRDEYTSITWNSAKYNFVLP